MPGLTVLTVMPARSAVGGRPCVVDQAVGVSAGQRAGDEPGAVAGVGLVSRQALGLAAVSAVCLCRRADRAGPAAVHDHRRVPGREAAGDGLADAGTGTVTMARWPLSCTSAVSSR
jgi:hypothetical protein